MEFPNNLKYTKDHEWVLVEGDSATIGITEFAQSELGDLVFVDLPSVGKTLKQGETLCVVESTKAASDVYSPVSGSVKEVNTALGSAPEKVNKSPYKEGWLAKLTKFSQVEVSALMSADQYRALLGAKAA